MLASRGGPSRPRAGYNRPVLCEIDFTIDPPGIEARGCGNRRVRSRQSSGFGAFDELDEGATQLSVLEEPISAVGGGVTRVQGPRSIEKALAFAVRHHRPLQRERAWHR
jgi:hypothetical protein